MVKTAYDDRRKDIVINQAERRLVELYKVDHKVLLRLRANALTKRKESAQALYIFLESLPMNPIPSSLSRLCLRLNLGPKITKQNNVVRRVMKQLKNIGYLNYSEVKRGRSVFFIIHRRMPKLNGISNFNTLNSFNFNLNCLYVNIFYIKIY